MKDRKPQLLSGFLGTHECFPSIGSHGFVGFDAPEARVLISEISEAGDQQPLLSGRPGFICLTPAVPWVQAGDRGFERNAFFEEWCQGPWNNTRFARSRRQIAILRA